MPSQRYSQKVKPAEGKEILISLIGIESLEEMLWIASEPVPEDRFPPCIKNLLSRQGEAGRHRKGAILAAFLGQLGWSEIDAKRLWSRVTDAEERIFTEWFGRMHCPKCATLKEESKGYPDLGMADLGCCCPDERCQDFNGPVEYAAELKGEDDRSKGGQRHIKTIYLARVLDWSTGREAEIELSRSEREELESLLAEKTGNEGLIYTRARVRGRLRPRFFLREGQELRRRVLSEFL